MITTLKKEQLIERDFIKLSNLAIEDYDLLKSLLQYESISGMESEVALYVEVLLTEMNFEVKKDGMGNICATRGVSDNYPLMNAHLDIVNLNRGYKSYLTKGSTKVSSTSKEKKKKEAKLYNSLALDSFDYNYSTSIKKDKKNSTNASNFNSIDISEEEAIEIWNERHTDLAMCFLTEF